jgi:UDP-GlcNAc3NAcA epimerase
LKTIVHIVGNRPQFIKLAVLHREIQKHALPQQIIHTGQHSDLAMSDIFFKELVIPDPDINLAIVQAHADMFIGEASVKLQQQLINIPDRVVFAYGDTNTTLAAALAARRTTTTLIHFEAGVRTGDNSMPEEINRVMTDRLADINYCCTQLNKKNLEREGHHGFLQNRILLTGDLMFDAFQLIEPGREKVAKEDQYIACTIHRAGNILSRDRLAAIIDGLNRIHRVVPVIMPLHPHTRKRIHEFGLHAEFTLLPPLGYPSMKNLLENSKYVITDSGGAAREAFFAGKKSIVVMERPFWPEIIEAGCAINVKPSAEAIFKAFENLPGLTGNFQTPIFGNGNAARIIAKDLASIVSIN